MRMLAGGPPVRGEGRYHTGSEGGTRAQGYQCIHIRPAVAQCGCGRLPEWPASAENNWQRQCSQKQISARKMPLGHADHDHRQCDQQRQPPPSPTTSQLLVTFVLLYRSRFGSCERSELIARRSDNRLQLTQGDQVSRPRRETLAGGEIHTGCHNAGRSTQRSFHAGDATRAVHSLHLKADRFQRIHRSIYGDIHGVGQTRLRDPRFSKYPDISNYSIAA